MSNIIESYGDYGYKMPRNQREAGLEFKQWDERSRPIKKSYTELAKIACVVVSVAYIVYRVAKAFV